MNKTRILATGIYVPKKIVTNDDLSQTIDTNHQWIFERTGIAKRHISDPINGEFPSDMAVYAAKEALDKANLEANDIDLIIFAGCMSDYFLPNTATIIQTKLGIKNKCAAFDISVACSGFVYGLTIADNFIKTGLFKHILVVGSEMLSPLVDWTDRSTCILFGDGAGCAIVGKATEDESGEVLASTLGADGLGKEFFHMEYGGACHPITKDVIDKRLNFMRMQGKEMFKVAVRTLAENAKEVLRLANMTISEVDWIVPHQANKRIIEATAKALEADMSKVILNIDKYANTSAATIPIAFHEAISDKRIKRGHVVLFDAFGAGLTSGATLFRY